MPLVSSPVLDQLVDQTRRLAAPPPQLRISEWAERYRELSREASEAWGPWRNHRMPHLVEIMDAALDPRNEITIALMPSQSGKTEAALNVLAYHIHQDPRPALLLLPTIDTCEDYMRTRIRPMVRDTSVLHVLIGDPKSRDGDNTLRTCTYPGGALRLVGANSPSGIASKPVGLLVVDELDAYEESAGSEGDPFDLARRRTQGFRRRRILAITTPRASKLSRSEKLWLRSDQRWRHFPCPECGLMQPLWFSPQYRPAHMKLPADAGFLRWEKDEDGEPSEARYVCVGCKAEITESKRGWMIRRGKWIATRPFRGIAGFRMNALGSPLWSWSAIVKEFYAAKDSTAQLQVFVNTVLAEYWDDLGESVAPESLLARREKYPEGCDVPKDALVLTAGVDVQDNRLELTVMGWGLEQEAWAVEHVVLWGNTLEAEVWDSLTGAIEKTYAREGSEDRLRILSTCIDSGFRTQVVYGYCKGKVGRRIFATKGEDLRGIPLVSSSRKKRTGRDRRPFELQIVGTDDAKGTIFSRMRKLGRGPGCMHWPDHACFDAGYFAGLSSEVPRIVKDQLGRWKRTWVQTAERNEALDCMVLALAALHLLNPNLQRLAVHAGLLEAPPSLPRPPARPAGVSPWSRRRGQDWRPYRTPWASR